MILLVDNYDSFVFNLARYFERLGQQTHVVRNDSVDVAGVLAMRPAAVVLSPGPCTPTEAGASLELVRGLHDRLPILGICLGHQVIAQALGATVIRADEPVHGRSWPILHRGQGLFAGLSSPLSGCRYHSLVVDPVTLPPELEVTAWTAEGTIMALEHRELPVAGIQFHPESILTDHGYPLLAAFLRRAGLTLPAVLPERDSELAEPPEPAARLPTSPVTF